MLPVELYHKKNMYKIKFYLFMQAPSPSTCQWVLWPSLAGLRLFWLSHMIEGTAV